MLVDPECFEQVMFVIVVMFVQAVDPGLDGGDNFVAVMESQFPTGAIAGAIFRFLQ